MPETKQEILAPADSWWERETKPGWVCKRTRELQAKRLAEQGIKLPS